MPNRTLKESICTSESLAKLSAEAERLFYHLLTAVDDYGRFDGRAQVVRTRCFPFHERMSNEDIDRCLAELEQTKTIERYEVDGKPYLWMPGWFRHNKPRAKESKWPEPPSFASVCQQLQTDADECEQPPAYPGPDSDSTTDSNTKPASEKEPPDLTKTERLILAELQAIAGPKYKFSPYLEQVRKLAVDFPTLDLLEEAKKLRAWLNGETTKNPLLRYRNWLVKAKPVEGRTLNGSGIDWSKFLYRG